MRARARRYSVTVVEGVLTGSVGAMVMSAVRIAPRLASANVVHVHTVRAALVSMLASPAGHVTRSVATIHNPYQRSTAGMYTTARIVALSTVDDRSIRAQLHELRHPAIVRNATLGSPRMTRTPTDAVGLPPNSIVFAGALTERKGVDVLLHAMVRVRAAVPTASLHVVGNRDNPAMESLAEELGLREAVRFTGFKSDPRSTIAAGAVFVLPARADGFPLALLEARSCGVPIIASAVGGIPEAMSNGEAGLLIEPGDADVLADALIRVLTDPPLAARLRSASRQGLESMTVERMADEYDRVYEGLSLRRSNL